MEGFILCLASDFRDRRSRQATRREVLHDDSVALPPRRLYRTHKGARLTSKRSEIERGHVKIAGKVWSSFFVGEITGKGVTSVVKSRFCRQFEWLVLTSPSGFDSLEVGPRQARKGLLVCVVVDWIKVGVGNVFPLLPPASCIMQHLPGFPPPPPPVYLVIRDVPAP